MRAHRRRDAGVIAALVFLTACGGDPEYVPAPIDMGTAVAVADVDGDGRSDIVLHADGAVWWMPQSATAPGSFSAPQPLP